MSCEPIWSNIPSMTIHIRRCFHVNLNGLVCQFGQSLLHRLKCMWPQFIFGLHENRCCICVHSTMDKWKLWLVASNTHTHTLTQPMILVYESQAYTHLKCTSRSANALGICGCLLFSLLMVWPWVEHMSSVARAEYSSQRNRKRLTHWNKIPSNRNNVYIPNVYKICCWQCWGCVYAVDMPKCICHFLLRHAKRGDTMSRLNSTFETRSHW